MITPSGMSIGVKQGFSIIKYSSPDDSGGAVSTATVPHGLSSAPDLIICKNLDTGYNWDIYHSSVSYSAIFTTAAINSRNAFSTIDSNIFTTKDTFTHHDDDEYIAYCFTSIEGYSAFGSYTGTNSAADGPFIYTGFKPAFVMIKGIQIDVNYPDYYSWIMFDNQRPEYNSSNTLPLYANQAKVEGQRGGSTVSFGEGVDFLSNGFKIRNVWGEINYTFTYIYMAFAEMPQKYAVAR